MQTIILSAGKSSRFGVDGFPYQKCMLPMPDGRALLEWQVDYLNPEKLLYISRKEYRDQELSLIKKIGLRQKNFARVWLEHNTRGALDGLWQARNHISKDEELLISYNDELVDPEVLADMLAQARKYHHQSAIVAFTTDNPRFTEVPGSDLFAGCTYYFADGKDFMKKLRRNNKFAENGCPDIVYQYRSRLYWHVPQEKFIELGTAAEYKLWAGKQGMTKEDMGF